MLSTMDGGVVIMEQRRLNIVVDTIDSGGGGGGGGGSGANTILVPHPPLSLHQHYHHYLVPGEAQG